MGEVAINETCGKLAAELRTFLDNVLHHGHFDLKAEVEIVEGSTVQATFHGGDIPLLLGHTAELMNTLEYLASRVFAQYLHGDVRMRFDARGFRAAREQELRMMAETAAQQVKRFRKPFKLNPMSSSERRVVHLALSGDNQVRTESEGDGEYRQVVIFPA